MVIYSLRKLGLIFHGLERGKYGDGDKCKTDQHEMGDTGKN